MEAEANSKAKVLKRSWKRKQFFQNQALPDFQTLKLAATVGVKCNNNNNIESTIKAWYGMERKFCYGILKMLEWNGRFQKWNGRKSSILPCQFHIRFRALYLQKNIYESRVVINNIVTEVFNFNIYEYYLSTNRGYLVVYIQYSLRKWCMYCVIVIIYIAICNIDVIVDNFDRFHLFFCFFLD